MKLLLGSSSPRRKEILSRLNIPFECDTPEVDESILPDESPETYVKRICRAKNEVITKRNSDSCIICADTIVVGVDSHDRQQILGKPHNRKHAGEMLTMLSGKPHRVISGISVSWPGVDKNRHIHVELAETIVDFAVLSPAQVEWYLDSMEWQDAAGAYKIQGKAGAFIKNMNGSYYTVMGLPIDRIYGILSQISAFKHNLPA